MTATLRDLGYNLMVEIAKVMSQRLQGALDDHQDGHDRHVADHASTRRARKRFIGSGRAGAPLHAGGGVRIVTKWVLVTKRITAF